MAKIVTLTLNPTVDKNTSVPVVVSDLKLRCAYPTYKPGGGGINVSRAIHNLGGISDAYYICGGLTGKILEHFLTESEIMHHPIHIKEWARENLTVLEETTGEQFRFTMPGPNLSAEESETCFKTVSTIEPAPEYFVASGSLPGGVPDDFYARLAREMKRRKIKMIVDTSRKAFQAVAKEGVFLLKPNLHEFSELVGKQLISETDQATAALEFVKSGACEVLVLSLGADGVLLATREGCKRIYSPDVPVVSRIGAGDSMVAGIVVGFTKGKSVEDAVRYGVAAGSAAVMMPASELCTLQDTEKLFSQVKVSSCLTQKQT